MAGLVATSISAGNATTTAADRAQQQLSQVMDAVPGTISDRARAAAAEARRYRARLAAAAVALALLAVDARMRHRRYAARR